uniref:Uncharacterized protein n=1 Tax=Arundo donax TaxID=35708 RepID=A0A0A8ZYM1_ARUDO
MDLRSLGQSNGVLAKSFVHIVHVEIVRIVKGAMHIRFKKGQWRSAGTDTLVASVIFGHLFLHF